MRVLALSINFQGFTVETLYHEQVALQREVEAAGGKIFFCGPGYDYPSNDVAGYVESLDRAGERPDIILSYLSEQRFFAPLPEEYRRRFALPDQLQDFPRGVEKVRGIPKVMWINDFWHMTPQQWDFTLLGHGFGHAIATYCPPFLSRSHFEATYSTQVREQVTFHPLSRGISPHLFPERSEPRNIDVCLLGARGEFYPLREYFHETLERQTWLNYFTAPHPGYSYDQATTLSGPAYASVLSRSRIFVSCTGRYSVPFIKIFEVLASGALLVCDRPCGAAELGLVDGENYVEVDRVNFLEKVHYYLNNEAERARVAAAGRDLYLQRHTTAANAATMYQCLAAIVESSAAVTTESASGPIAVAAQSEPAEQPQPQAAPRRRLADAIAKGVGLLRGRSDVPATTVPLPCPSPWEEIKGGSCLDWGRVIEVRHALEICQLDSLAELSLVERFGLNAHWGDPAVLTQFPETVAVRAKILKLLAAALGATAMCEVGTARGLQSMFWAEYLLTRAASDGVVATCDIVGHDEPCFRTPLTGAALWSRRELWSQVPFGAEIEFVHGDSTALAAALDQKLVGGRTIDLAYIDGRHDEEGAWGDFCNLKRHLGRDCVLVFDDCDPRFPGVERAVNRVACEMDSDIRLVSFWPGAYKVAVLNSAVALSAL